MKFFFVGIFFICYSICSAQVNKNSGLVAYYPFNKNAKDESGNKNNPIYNNAKLTSDRFGNPKSAYHFNGKNNFIKIPNSKSLNIKDEITISAWVKINDFYKGKCHGNRIISKGNTDYLQGGYFIGFNDMRYTQDVLCETKVADVTHETFVSNISNLNNGGKIKFVDVNNWHILTYVSDGKAAKLFVDCELVETGIIGNKNNANNADLFLGCFDNVKYPYWFNGDLDDVRIYNRALSDDEIVGLCEKYPFVNNTLIATDTTTKQLLPQKRNNNYVQEIEVINDSISVSFYDNAEIDGDSITIQFNDKIVATHLRLAEEPATFIFKLDKSIAVNQVIMYAENLGSIPPNTSLMIIYDGKKRYVVNIRSDVNNNGVVGFRLKR
jgi:Concanavalin A-like lectin/glucanases superfamily